MQVLGDKTGDNRFEKRAEMDQILDWVVRIGVASLVWWVLRSYLQERTKRQKPGDQLISLCDLNKRCQEQKTEIIKGVEKDMRHIADILKGELNRGQERFKRLDDRFEKIEEKYKVNNEMLIKISVNVERLVKAADAEAANHPG